jgi:hypothetical protein
MKICIYGIMMIALFGMAAPASAQVAVIGNKSIGSAVFDMTKVKNLYILVSNEVNGGKVKLFDIQGESPVKEKFFTSIGKSTAEVKKVWLKARLTNNGVPPEIVGSEEEMLAKVESTPGGIGYISADKVNSKVKTLLIIN